MPTQSRDSAHFEDSTPYDLVASDTAWHASGTGSESQTLYVVTNDGAIVLLQVAWAHVGLFPTIQVSMRYNGSGGVVAHRTVNCSTFNLAEDRRSVKTDAMNVTASQQASPKGSNAGATWEFKFGLSNSDAKHLRGSVVFEVVDRGYKVGPQGNVLLSQSNGDEAKFMSHRYFPFGKCRGEMVIENKTTVSLDGVGTFIHAHGGGVKPHSVAPRWSLLVASLPSAEVYSRQTSSDEWTKSGDYNGNANAHLSLLRYITSKQFGSEHISMGGFVWNGKLYSVTTQNTCDYLDTSFDKDTKYEVPAHVKYHLAGNTLPNVLPANVIGDKEFAGPTATFEGDLTFDTNNKSLIAKVDVLAELPYLIRKVIQALITRPFLYQHFNEVKPTVTLTDTDGSQIKLVLSGRAFHEQTYMD
ncbi:hypothetical protein GQ42DRAFT_30081 [Ramicandelaber brevisporus]|nr:hypothetical protein GQ42DRAFT_30081 [Ramicandelaber brevisporus]